MYRIAWMNVDNGNCGVESDFIGSQDEMSETLNWYANDPQYVYWLVRVGERS